MNRALLERQTMRAARTKQTAAIRALGAAGVPFTVRPYPYVAKGGTRASAAALGVEEHRVVKTLVMETDAGKPFIVLMHGDRLVSTKQLARTLGVKRVAPCKPAVAEKHSGYLVGGTSPFGTRTAMPVYCEAGILDLDSFLINAGARGFLVEITPEVLVEVLDVTLVEVAAVR
ncbi:MAG: Cys-tRNA(Pro) deacylase [Myxococcota bacterium]|jgi:Cys-tRNA(Pro) deacylase